MGYPGGIFADPHLESARPCERPRDSSVDDRR